MGDDERARAAVSALDEDGKARLACAIGCMDELKRWWLARKVVEPTGFAREINRRQELRVVLDGMADAELAREVEVTMTEEEMGSNSLGRLNDALFAELENLQNVDPKDADALRAEVERSKAVEGIARTIIDNASTVLDATRIRASLTKSVVAMPKMLEG